MGYATKINLLLILLCVLTAISCNKKNPTESGPVTVTDVDGNTYETVKIGNRVWTTENIRVTHYRDGSPISNMLSNSEWGNTSNGAYVTCKKNGQYFYYYNWYAVNDDRDIAPAGWHVPTESEWNIMKGFLGGVNVGGKMKSTDAGAWESPNVGATNESGFNAYPNGYRGPGGVMYCDRNDEASFWSSTESSPSRAISYGLGSYTSEVMDGPLDKHHGFCVRLIKDME